MLNLRKALTLIFTVLLTVSFIPFSTAFAHTTAAPANGQNLEAAETAENPENTQATQHEHHGTQETDNAQDGQVGVLEVLLLILFTLLVAAPSGLLWWFIARDRPH